MIELKWDTEGDALYITLTAAEWDHTDEIETGNTSTSPRMTTPSASRSTTQSKRGHWSKFSLATT
jgi:hypothetical protein